MGRKEQKLAKDVAKTGARTFGSIILLILKIIGTILLIGITTSVIFACIFSVYVKTNLSTDLDVTLDDFTLDQTSVLYYADSSGSYQQLVSLQSTENRIWVSYDNIPIDAEHAVVAIEDKRFYDHHGVDWYRTTAAFFNMFLSNSDTFGGSTITQQLIKNLTEDNEVTVQRKLLEIFRALELEKTYTKQEIMEWYLNVVYFGHGCYGIGAAAKYYYGKDVSDLSLAEIASIIAITNNPSMYSPDVNPENNKERQENVLKEMYTQGYITEDQYNTAVKEKLVLNQSSEESDTTDVTYSYFADAVIEDVISDLMTEKGCSYSIAEQLLFTGGYQIYTTLNKEIQADVDSVYTDTENNLVTDNGNQLQSAIVITDPYTGDIVAMSGGMGQKTANRTLNRATQSKRPPGSSFKPISVYAPAMDLGLITPDTYYNDGAEVKLSGTDWMPQNDSLTYSGVVDIRTAVVNSINTVAAQVMDLLTPQVSYNFLTEKLGITSLVYYRDEDGVGISDVDYAPLALGQLSDGITVREMATAYSIFPNSGICTQSRTYSKITDADGNVIIDKTPATTVAISEATAYWMTDILSDAVDHGTGTEADLGDMPTAGKTGTTSDKCDRWFVGFTPYYVAACWVGYDTPEEIDWSGNPAAQMWYKVMSLVHENLEIKDFTVPEDTYLSPVPGVDNIPSPSPSVSPSESPSPSVTPSATPTPEVTVAPSPDVTETPSTDVSPTHGNGNN